MYHCSTSVVLDVQIRVAVATLLIVNGMNAIASFFWR